MSLLFAGSLMLPVSSSAQITNTQVVDIKIGSSTGANTKFNTNALIYNFGITTSGGFDYLMTNMFFQLDRGVGVDSTNKDVFVQVFNGFGGTGSLILSNRINYTNVGTAFAQVNLLLGTNLIIGPGSYSVRLTSGSSGSGSDSYQFKLGQLVLTDTNGASLPVMQWVEDTDPNGTATTNLVTTNPILADFAISTNNVNFGNYRVGSTLSSNVVLTNNGFATTNNLTGSLQAAATSSNAATVSGVTTNAIAQGQTNSFNVGLATTNVGTNTGTVTLNYQSATNGTAISNRATWPTNIGSQTVAVSGVGYRLADDAVSTTNVNLGNFRIVDGAGTGSVTITNTAAADGFSESLEVTNAATSGAATVTNVPGGLIASGGTTNVTVGLGTANAGTNSGTVTLGFASDGAGTSGFAATNVGSQVVNVVGVGFRLADESVSTTNVNLGRFHIGASNITGSLGVTNTATADGFSEGLAVANNGTSGGATVGGIPGGLLAAGANTNLTVGLGSITTVGTNSGTITLGFQSSGIGTSGFAATNIGSQVINIIAQGYSGQAFWNVNGSGSWNDFDNWDVPGGTPGIDGVLLSTNDQATFGNAIGASRTVSLNGQNPVLTLLAFSNASSSYTIAQGSGGSITMGTESATQTIITNAAGTHSVGAAIALARATQVGVATNSKLSVSALNGTNNLNKSGAGTLSITGSGNLSGLTTVTGGTLNVNGSISDSAVTVSTGATLSGSGTVGEVSLANGATISPGNSPDTLNIVGDVNWFGGANYNWEILDASTNNAPGTTWDFISATGQLDLGLLSSTNKFNINLWTLSSASPDVSGLAANFNNTQSYRWTILTAAGGITGGFDTNKFNVNLAAINGTDGWANDLGGGNIFVDVQGNNLDLVFNPNVGPEPIPEPGTWAAAALLLGAAGYVRWRRRKL